MSTSENTDNLEEGCLYVYKKGELMEIEQDPDDLTKKIKITRDAFSAASDLQKRLRNEMSGYRPDLTTICSALIEYTANTPTASHIVRDFAVRLFNSMQGMEE